MDLSDTSELKGELMWLVPPRVLLLGLRPFHPPLGSPIGDKDR